ncbi:hypothetical protein AZI86_14485 [Bdellovibrio bacteriovorus]|uniref:Uncharacterized protein n=1 Tax=Bdellovibrio bacteriovorus TaxID=959 RepID=A0A150WKE5_BDEBC|nr:hypothetical protein [Bdellovibrio bacteriovorus]KYG64011.1 hypothetical protein AZI86_14485 [Bdellovibrio bacteriovorus]
MELEILSLLSVIFFCLCSHQLIKTVVRPIPLLASERPYARAAMQLGKFYKSLAWGAMTAAFLMGLVFSFQQVFQTL